MSTRLTSVQGGDNKAQSTTFGADISNTTASRLTRVIF